MKIVLDTNVIIASFATRGLCAEVFEICIIDHEVFISEFILTECRDKLTNKLKTPLRITEGIIDYLRSNTTLVLPAEVDIDCCDDKKDLAVLGTAVATDSDLLITGDKKILKTKTIFKTSIVTPRDFWTICSLME
ncbi:putative toxin-antitoxin system toxin component, PIN family [Candidatus Margulisiibacteriota bacterium]